MSRPKWLVLLATIFHVTREGMMIMFASLGMTLLGMFLWQATETPDISGQWTSGEWGTVMLEAKTPGQYVGTFYGSDKDKPGFDISDVPGYNGDVELTSHPVLTKTKLGTVELKWSRVERRFNGTWKKGVTRSGKMSLRLVDTEIRGAWTTNKDVQKESDSPRLADLFWKRIVATVPDGTQVLGDSTPSDNTAAELAYAVTLKLLPGTENRRIELPGSSKVSVEVLDGDLRFSGEKKEVESAVEMNRKIIKSVARTLNDENQVSSRHIGSPNVSPETFH